MRKLCPFGRGRVCNATCPLYDNKTGECAILVLAKTERYAVLWEMRNDQREE